MEKTFIKEYWMMIAGMLIGAMASYLYWRFVGCTTGTCPITSSPLNMTLWGGIMGGLLGNMLQPHTLNKDEQDN